MKTVKILARWFAYWNVSALSGGLIYLYFYGSWYDQIKWIEIAELVLFFCLVPFGLWLLVDGIIEEVKKKG